MYENMLKKFNNDKMFEDFDVAGLAFLNIESMT